MGKGKKRYFESNTSSATAASSSKRKRDKDPSGASGRPADPESRDFYYDAVDEFHHSKEKVYLDRAKRRSPDREDEEVYRIRSDDDDDDEEEQSDQDGEAVEDESEDQSDDMRSDISGDEDEEGYLPSADAWGKRRKAYYSTDFVGDDRAGLSGSDVEAAELEEEEAISLQKRLAQQMTEDDFKLDTMEAATSSSKAKPTSVDASDKDVVQADLSALSEEEKLELLRHQSPELLALIEEYKAKAEAIQKYLEPVSKALSKHRKESGERVPPVFHLISEKYKVYMNYMINLQFYFVLKAMRLPVENHPVIDRITTFKKLVDQVDEKCNILEDHIERIAKIIEGGSSISDIMHLIAVPDVPEKKKKNKSASKAKELATGKKRVRWEVDNDDEEEPASDQEEDVEENEEREGEKRGVTYEIEKNKGVTPNRKKEQRNPRVKNRMRFKKAVHRKKSQVPDARKELQRYGGEIRGIKPNVVRSVKLH